MDIVHNMEMLGKKNTSSRELNNAIYVLKNYIENLLDKKEMEQK
jgi:hypothetical protein